MNEVFVDDNDILMEAPELGVKWNEKANRMIFDREEEKKDKEKKEKDYVRTMREVRTMVNTICDDIQMEETVASQCKGGKLPILDFQAWSEVETDREGKEKLRSSGNSLRKKWCLDML